MKVSRYDVRLIPNEYPRVIFSDKMIEDITRYIDECNLEDINLESSFFEFKFCVPPKNKFHLNHLEMDCYFILPLCSFRQKDELIGFINYISKIVNAKIRKEIHNNEHTTS